MSAEWVERWREDLRFAAERLEEVHADAYHTVGREELEQRFAALAARLPALDHHQAVAELAGIVAAVGDGHTRLTLPLRPDAGFEQGHAPTEPPRLDALVFHPLPVRFALYGDEVYVQRIESRHREAVGSRVVAVDGRPMAEVLEALAPTIRRDNEMQVRHHLPMHLALPEMLHACGVTRESDRATLEVETATGERLTVAVEPPLPGSRVEWVDARDDAESPTRSTSGTPSATSGSPTSRSIGPSICSSTRSSTTRRSCCPTSP